MIADAMSATAQFVADLDGLYVVQLIVNDGVVDSAPDTATVSATTGNEAPTAVASANANTSLRQYSPKLRLGPMTKFTSRSRDARIAKLNIRRD